MGQQNPMSSLMGLFVLFIVFHILTSFALPNLTSTGPTIQPASSGHYENRFFQTDNTTAGIHSDFLSISSMPYVSRVFLQQGTFKIDPNEHVLTAGHSYTLYWTVNLASHPNLPAIMQSALPHCLLFDVLLEDSDIPLEYVFTQLVLHRFDSQTNDELYNYVEHSRYVRSYFKTIIMPFYTGRLRVVVRLGLDTITTDLNSSQFFNITHSCTNYPCAGGFNDCMNPFFYNRIHFCPVPPTKCREHGIFHLATNTCICDILNSGPYCDLPNSRLVYLLANDLPFSFYSLTQPEKDLFLLSITSMVMSAFYLLSYSLGYREALNMFHFHMWHQSLITSGQLVQNVYGLRIGFGGTLDQVGPDGKPVDTSAFSITLTDSPLSQNFLLFLLKLGSMSGYTHTHVNPSNPLYIFGGLRSTSLPAVLFEPSYVTPMLMNFTLPPPPTSITSLSTLHQFNDPKLPVVHYMDTVTLNFLAVPGYSYHILIYIKLRTSQCQVPFYMFPENYQRAPLSPGDHLSFITEDNPLGEYNKGCSRFSTLTNLTANIPLITITVPKVPLDTPLIRNGPATFENFLQIVNMTSTVQIPYLGEPTTFSFIEPPKFLIRRTDRFDSYDFSTPFVFGQSNGGNCNGGYLQSHPLRCICPPGSFGFSCEHKLSHTLRFQLYISDDGTIQSYTQDDKALLFSAICGYLRTTCSDPILPYMATYFNGISLSLTQPSVGRDIIDKYIFTLRFSSTTFNSTALDLIHPTIILHTLKKYEFTQYFAHTVVIDELHDLEREFEYIPIHNDFLQLFTASFIPSNDTTIYFNVQKTHIHRIQHYGYSQQFFAAFDDFCKNHSDYGPMFHIMIIQSIFLIRSTEHFFSRPPPTWSDKNVSVNEGKLFNITGLKITLRSETSHFWMCTVNSQPVECDSPYFSACGLHFLKYFNSTRISYCVNHDFIVSEDSHCDLLGLNRPDPYRDCDFENDLIYACTSSLDYFSQIPHPIILAETNVSDPEAYLRILHMKDLPIPDSPPETELNISTDQRNIIHPLENHDLDDSYADQYSTIRSHLDLTRLISQSCDLSYLEPHIVSQNCNSCNCSLQPSKPVCLYHKNSPQGSGRTLLLIVDNLICQKYKPLSQPPEMHSSNSSHIGCFQSLSVTSFEKSSNSPVVKDSKEHISLSITVKRLESPLRLTSIPLNTTTPVVDQAMILPAARYDASTPLHEEYVVFMLIPVDSYDAMYSNHHAYFSDALFSSNSTEPTPISMPLYVDETSKPSLLGLHEFFNPASIPTPPSSSTGSTLPHPHDELSAHGVYNTSLFGLKVFLSSPHNRVLFESPEVGHSLSVDLLLPPQLATQQYYVVAHTVKLHKSSLRHNMPPIVHFYDFLPQTNSRYRLTGNSPPYIISIPTHTCKGGCLFGICHNATGRCSCDSLSYGPHCEFRRRPEIDDKLHAVCNGNGLLVQQWVQSDQPLHEQQYRSVYMNRMDMQTNFSPYRRNIRPIPQEQCFCFGKWRTKPRSDDIVTMNGAMVLDSDNRERQCTLCTLVCPQMFRASPDCSHCFCADLTCATNAFYFSLFLTRRSTIIDKRPVLRSNFVSVTEYVCSNKLRYDLFLQPDIDVIISPMLLIPEFNLLGETPKSLRFYYKGIVIFPNYLIPTEFDWGLDALPQAGIARTYELIKQQPRLIALFREMIDQSVWREQRDPSLHEESQVSGVLSYAELPRVFSGFSFFSPFDFSHQMGDRSNLFFYGPNIPELPNSVSPDPHLTRSASPSLDTFSTYYYNTISNQYQLAGDIWPAGNIFFDKSTRSIQTVCVDFTGYKWPDSYCRFPYFPNHPVITQITIPESTYTGSTLIHLPAPRVLLSPHYTALNNMQYPSTRELPQYFFPSIVNVPTLPPVAEIIQSHLKMRKMAYDTFVTVRSSQQNNHHSLYTTAPHGPVSFLSFSLPSQSDTSISSFIPKTNPTMPPLTQPTYPVGPNVPKFESFQVFGDPEQIVISSVILIEWSFNKNAAIGPNDVVLIELDSPTSVLSSVLKFLPAHSFRAKIQIPTFTQPGISYFNAFLYTPMRYRDENISVDNLDPNYNHAALQMTAFVTTADHPIQLVRSLELCTDARCNIRHYENCHPLTLKCYDPTSFIQTIHTPDETNQTSHKTRQFPSFFFSITVSSEPTALGSQTLYFSSSNRYSVSSSESPDHGNTSSNRLFDDFQLASHLRSRAKVESLVAIESWKSPTMKNPHDQLIPEDMIEYLSENCSSIDPQYQLRYIDKYHLDFYSLIPTRNNYFYNLAFILQLSTGIPSRMFKLVNTTSNTLIVEIKTSEEFNMDPQIIFSKFEIFKNNLLTTPIFLSEYMAYLSKLVSFRVVCSTSLQPTIFGPENITFLTNDVLSQILADETKGFFDNDDKKPHRKATQPKVFQTTHVDIVVSSLWSPSCIEENNNSTTPVLSNNHNALSKISVPLGETRTFDYIQDLFNRVSKWNDLISRQTSKYHKDSNSALTTFTSTNTSYVVLKSVPYSICSQIYSPFDLQSLFAISDENALQYYSSFANDPTIFHNSSNYRDFLFLLIFFSLFLVFGTLLLSLACLYKHHLACFAPQRKKKSKASPNSSTDKSRHRHHKKHHHATENGHHKHKSSKHHHSSKFPVELQVHPPHQVSGQPRDHHRQSRHHNKHMTQPYHHYEHKYDTDDNILNDGLARTRTNRNSLHPSLLIQHPPNSQYIRHPRPSQQLVTHQPSEPIVASVQLQQPQQQPQQHSNPISHNHSRNQQHSSFRDLSSAHNSQQSSKPIARRKR